MSKNGNGGNIFAADVYVHTRTPGTHVHWQEHAHTLAHSLTHTQARQAALNVGHWALLSLKRAETVPKPPLQSDCFRTPEKNTDAVVAPANRRRWELVFNCAQRPLPSRIADRSRRVLLTWALHRGGGGREGWGEKQEAYFTLRCTVMRNRDSRAHYFANIRSENREATASRAAKGEVTTFIACFSSNKGRLRSYS